MPEPDALPEPKMFGFFKHLGLPGPESFGLPEPAPFGLPEPELFNMPRLATAIGRGDHRHARPRELNAHAVLLECHRFALVQSGSYCTAGWAERHVPGWSLHWRGDAEGGSDMLGRNDSSSQWDPPYAIWRMHAADPTLLTQSLGPTNRGSFTTRIANAAGHLYQRSYSLP